MSRLSSLIAISLLPLLASCAGLKPFPTDRLWEYDRKDRVCGEYQITHYEPKLRFKHLKDHALDKCPAIFGFSSSDIADVLDWSEDAVAYSKKHCR